MCKAKVVLAVVKDKSALAKVALQFDVHPNQITNCKDQLREGVASVVGQEKSAPKDAAVDLKGLHTKISELTLANDFFPARSPRRDCWVRKNVRPRSRTTDHPAGEGAGGARNSVIYTPRAVSAEDLV